MPLPPLLRILIQTVLGVTFPWSIPLAVATWWYVRTVDDHAAMTVAIDSTLTVALTALWWAVTRLPG